MKTLIFFYAMLASFSCLANYDSIKTGDYAEYDATWIKDGVKNTGYVTFEILDENFDFYTPPKVRKCVYKDGEKSPVCSSGRVEVNFEFLYYPKHIKEVQDCWKKPQENLTVKAGTYETCIFKTYYAWYDVWNSKWWSTSALFGLVKSVQKNITNGEEILELRYFKAMPRN